MTFAIVERFIKPLYGMTYDLVSHNIRARSIIEGIGSYLPYIYDPLLEGAGATGSSRYCYSIWLKHLSLAMDNGLQRYPETVVELGPGASIGTGLAALIAGAKHYHALDVLDYTNNKLNVKIFDELVTLFTKRERVPEVVEFPAQILTDDYLDLVLDGERLEAIRDSLIADDGKFISYSLSCDDPNIIREGSIDLLFSHAVMEHVEDIAVYYRNMYLWLKQGGMVSHQIDFECHGLADEWNGHWAYSAIMWKVIRGKKKDMLNRHMHSDHIDCMHQVNLNVVREIKLEGGVGIARSKLASKFRGMSDDDLKTKGSIILAMKT